MTIQETFISNFITKFGTDNHTQLTPFLLCDQVLDSLQRWCILNDEKNYLVISNIEFLDRLINRGVRNIWFATSCDKKAKFARKLNAKIIKYSYENFEETFTSTMKFDVIVGNPPYQLKVGPKKTEPIWQKFVHKAFKLCKEDGYVSLIHPSGWRNAKSRFDDTKELIMSKNIKVLSLNDFNAGLEVFGVGTNFDWYVVQNTLDNNSNTDVITSEGENNSINLNKMPFIPNGKLEAFDNIIAKEGDEKVNIVFSTSLYDHRKPYLSEIENDTNRLPVIYTITRKNGIKTLFSSMDKGHFGIPKVIWSNGLGTYPVVDKEGKYAMTEFSAAIADDPENLESIAKALTSEKFLELMKYVKFKNDVYDYRVIGTFKKDFWKEFI